MLAEEIIDKLQILPTGNLKSHEEIIPYNLQKLRESMLNMGRLVDPLIVDKKSLVVIDGNHRKKVLDMIKCPNAACQLIDYMRPEITIGGWFPVSKTIGQNDIIGFKGEKVDFEAGMAAVNRMDATFLFVKKADGKKECLLYDSNEKSVQSVIGQQKKFLSALEGRDLQYIADDKYEDYLNAGYGVFCRRVYKKEEVVAEALAGRCMPSKSTRHMIPDRIIRLNLHLGWLSESPEACKDMMDNMLRKRLNEGAIRRYTETVIVLY